jgi:hypothetical protein
MILKLFQIENFYLLCNNLEIFCKKLLYILIFNRVELLNK